MAPATGDWVALAPNRRRSLVVSRGLAAGIGHHAPRPVRGGVEQVLVANVDVVGVVAGVDRPCNVAKLERFLVLAADSGAVPVWC